MFRIDIIVSSILYILLLFCDNFSVLKFTLIYNYDVDLFGIDFVIVYYDVDFHNTDFVITIIAQCKLYKRNSGGGKLKIILIKLN